MLIMTVINGCSIPCSIFAIYFAQRCSAFIASSACSSEQTTLLLSNHSDVIGSMDRRNDGVSVGCFMHTNVLTTASGKPVCRYALGGAARSVQSDSLPSFYCNLVSTNMDGVAPFFFYYNPHRYPAFLSGVEKSFVNDDYDNSNHTKESAPNENGTKPTRRDVFIASGSSDRSLKDLDQRLDDALSYSGGTYLDAFVLEYVCLEELTVVNSDNSCDNEPEQLCFGEELRAAFQHVRSYVAQGKVRYVIASTHSHLVGAVLATASLPHTESLGGISNGSKNSRRIPVLDALMLRYNFSHKKAAERLSLSNALKYQIPVIAFTTTRWNRLQSANISFVSTSDCIKFALCHPAVEIVLHSARDEVELEESLFPLFDCCRSSVRTDSLLQPLSTTHSDNDLHVNWLSKYKHEVLKQYGEDEVGWNEKDGFDEYPEESLPW